MPISAVKTKITNICCGPTVTRYELQPEIGVRVKSIQNLSDDIALHLAAAGVRIEAPIPGKQAVGIEIPNKTVSTVYIRNLIENPKFAQQKSRLSVCLGMDVAGSPVYMDIAKMPHLLIAGATGMGKSVCINSFIVVCFTRRVRTNASYCSSTRKKWNSAFTTVCRTYLSRS